MKNDDVNETPRQEEQPDSILSEETSRTATASEESTQPVSTSNESETQSAVVVGEPEVVASPVVAPKKRRKGLIALIVSIAAVLLLGGGAALAYFFWYQNPDKVLGDAFSNALSAKSVDFKASMKVTPSADVESTVKDVTITLNGKSNQELGFVDGTFEVVGNDGKAVKIDGSVIASEKELFFKLNQLEDVLNVILGAPEGKTILDTPFGPLVKKIDGNWVRVSEGDLSDVNEDYDKTQTCTAELSEKIKQDKSYLDELGEVYKKNRFIVVKDSLGSKTVSGVDSIGFSVEADPVKTKDFVKALGDTKIGKELKSCDDSIDFNEIADDIEPADTTSSEGTLEVWVSRFGHQLTGVNLSAKDDDTEVKVTSEYTFNQDVKIEKPSGAIDFKEVSEEYTKAAQEARSRR